MATETYETEPRKSGGSGCLKGCLIVFVILVLVVILGGWWLSRNWRGLASGMVSGAINDAVDQSDLPAAEKEEVKAQVKRISDGFSDGTISDQQMTKIAEGLVESPLVPMFMVKAVEMKYLDKSGLSEEEKAEGKVALARFARGMIDKKIPQQGIDQALQHIADRDAQGEWQIRDTVSDEELRKFLAEAKQQADDAQIPEEVPEIDPSDELKKIIDQALGLIPPDPAPNPPAAEPAEPAEPAEQTEPAATE